MPTTNTQAEEFQAALEMLDGNSDFSYTIAGQSATVTAHGHQITLFYHVDEWEADGTSYRLPGFYTLNDKGQRAEAKPRSLEELAAYILTWAGQLPNISREITVRRRALGLTQEELARFLSVSQASLAQWENGAYKPRSLADVLAELDRLERHADDLVLQVIQNTLSSGGSTVSATPSMTASYSRSFCDMVVARAAKQLREGGHTALIE